MGMIARDCSYSSAVALLSGYDLGIDGWLLEGFREWLLSRTIGGENLGWWALVLDFSFPGSRNPESSLIESPEAERLAVENLFLLIIEFVEERSSGWNS